MATTNQEQVIQEIPSVFYLAEIKAVLVYGLRIVYNVPLK